MKLYNVKRLLLNVGALLLGMSLHNSLSAFAVFNRSTDPNEIISFLVFENENESIEFFKKLGWTERIEDIGDRALLLEAIPAAWAITAFPVFFTFMATKIAEKRITKKYVWHQCHSVVTPEAQELLFQKIDREDISADDKIDKKLAFKTGAAWWWKSIKDDHGSKGNNPFILFFKVKDDDNDGKDISLEGLFKKFQSGAKYWKMQPIGSGYINRAAIMYYLGDNIFESYLPFQKPGQTTTEWLTIDEAKQQPTMQLKTDMTGCDLATIERVTTRRDIVDGTEFDQGTSLMISNKGKEPIHAFFVNQKGLKDLLAAGGWVNSTIEKLFEITGLVVGLAASTAELGGLGKDIEGIPGLGLLEQQMAIMRTILGDFPQQIAQILKVKDIKPKDYFANLYPGSFNYSYYDKSKPGAILRSKRAIKSAFAKKLDKNTDLILAIFATGSRELVDLKKPLFVGPFDRTLYNGVIFWSSEGQVEYVKYDLAANKITKKEFGLSVPAELSGDEVKLTAEGKGLLKQYIDGQPPARDLSPDAQKTIDDAKKLL